MFGTGMPELIVIFFLIGLCVILIVFISKFVSKTERQLKKDNDTIIREAKEIINELHERQKLRETSQFTTSDQIANPVGESSRVLRRSPSKAHRGLYILRHWRGELPLPVSYWLNVVVLSAVFVMVMRIVPWDTFVNESPKFCSTAVIAIWVLLAIATIWQWVGVWRSANSYLGQGKSRFWGNLAKIAVVLGMIGAVINFVSVGIPQITD